MDQVPLYHHPQVFQLPRNQLQEEEEEEEGGGVGEGISAPGTASGGGGGKTLSCKTFKIHIFG